MYVFLEKTSALFTKLLLLHIINHKKTSALKKKKRKLILLKTDVDNNCSFRNCTIFCIKFNNLNVKLNFIAHILNKSPDSTFAV